MWCNGECTWTGAACSPTTAGSGGGGGSGGTGGSMGKGGGNNSVTCLKITMRDTYGDTWNGNTFKFIDTVTDCPLAQGTHSQFGRSSVDQEVCLGFGCYEIVVGGGAYANEVRWSFGGLKEQGVTPGGTFFFITGNVASNVASCQEIMESLDKSVDEETKGMNCFVNSGGCFSEMSRPGCRQRCVDDINCIMWEFQPMTSMCCLEHCAPPLNATTGVLSCPLWDGSKGWKDKMAATSSVCADTDHHASCQALKAANPALRPVWAAELAVLALRRHVECHAPT